MGGIGSDFLLFLEEIASQKSADAELAECRRSLEQFGHDELIDDESRSVRRSLENEFMSALQKVAQEKRQR